MTDTKKTAEATTAINDAMNDGIERMTQGLSNAGAFGQENVEAFIESATTFAKGVEKIATENAEFAKTQMEAGQEKFQALSKVKSPQEFFEAQSELFKTSMETQMGQFSKMSDMFVSVTREAAQPLSKRYTAFVEVMQQR